MPMTLVKRKKTTIIFGLSIVFLSFVTFYKFIFGDSLFVYTDTNDDTFQSYLAAYQLVVNMIKQRDFSFYTEVAGLGANILSFQMVIFDPFAIPLYIIGLMFGIEYMADAMVYVQILRIIFGAMACRYFLKSFDLSETAVIIASTAYAFSSFFTGDIGQHYMFATGAVFIVLILGILEHVKYNGKNLLLLSICVAVCCIWSIYHCFMILLFAGFYTIVRWMQDEPLCLNNALKYFAPRLLAVLIGICMAGIIFVPMALLMLSTSNRLQTSDVQLGDIFSFLKPEQYKSMFMRIFSGQLEGNINNWQGADVAFMTPHWFCSVLFPIGLCQYFYRISKGKKTKRNIITFCSLIAIILLCCTKIAGTVFNAGTEYMTRYTFVFIPLCVYIVAWLIDILFKQQYNSLVGYIFCIVSVVFIYFGTMWDQRTSRISAINAIVCCVVLTVILSFVQRGTIIGKRRSYFIYAVVVMNLVIEGIVSLSVERNALSKEWYHQNLYDYDSKDAAQIMEEETDLFQRLERNFLAWGVQQASTYSEVNYYRGLSFYNSLINANLVKFRQEFLGVINQAALIRATYAFGDMGPAFDNTMADLLGLKYVVSDYKTDNRNWELIKEYHQKYLYKNKSMTTSGVIYYNWYTEDMLQKMDIVERQAALAHGVLLESYDENIVKNVKQLENIPLEKERMLDKKNVLVEEGELIDNDENQIRVDGENTKSLVFNVTQEKINSDRQLFLCFEFEVENSGNIMVLCDTGFGFSDVYWAQSSMHSKSGKKNLFQMKIPLETKRIKIISDSSGTITISDCKIMESEGASYSNEGINLYNPNKAGHVYGQIKMEQDGIFVLPICKENGWTAIVDGKEVEIMSANYAFMAFYLDAGEHVLELVYKTPGICVGIISSLIGAISFVIFLIAVNKIRKLSNR